jgi:peptidoglycan/LPS O-acetylase OafA/YrhL
MDQQAAEALKQIADKLDVPVQQLWAGLVAFAPFAYFQWEAILIGCIAALFICGLVLAVLVANAGKVESAFGDGIGLVCIVLFAGMVCSACGILAQLSSLGEAMAAQKAPEAWATQQLLKKIGK